MKNIILIYIIGFAIVATFIFSISYKRHKDGKIYNYEIIYIDNTKEIIKNYRHRLYFKNGCINDGSEFQSIRCGVRNIKEIK